MQISLRPAIGSLSSERCLRAAVGTLLLEDSVLTGYLKTHAMRWDERSGSSMR
jgi:hypothetical protein